MKSCMICELLEQKMIPTLASSDCVLVEFSPWEQFTTIQEGLFSIKACGFRPVLVHLKANTITKKCTILFLSFHGLCDMLIQM